MTIKDYDLKEDLKETKKEIKNWELKIDSIVYRLHDTIEYFGESAFDQEYTDNVMVLEQIQGELEDISQEMMSINM